MKKSNLIELGEIEDYFSQKFAQFGETPQGLDYNGERSQLLRFQQLEKLIDRQLPEFSVVDLGCGFGSFYQYLAKRHVALTSYVGNDISEPLLEAAQQRFHGTPEARFVHGPRPDVVGDYAFACGVFNLKLNAPEDAWYEYILESIDVLDRHSRLGFAFNCLTAYSDEPKKRPDLYYADPCRLFDYCKRRYSLNVALLHDYELYDFTILVRKIVPAG